MSKHLGITMLALCLMVAAPAPTKGARWRAGTPTAAPAIRATQDQAIKATTDDTRDDSDSTKEATGIVTDLACGGATQRIDVKTASETVHLRTSPGYRIHIEGSSTRGTGNPCASLTGMRVLVQYAPDRSNRQSGVIKSVRPATPESEGLVSASDGPLAVSATDAPAETSTPRQLESGDKITEDGHVTEVTCNGNEIFVKLSTGSRQFSLHARDYSRLTYDDDRSAFENRDFAACTRLKGLRASITFVVVEHKAYDGEIQSVEIEK